MIEKLESGIGNCEPMYKVVEYLESMKKKGVGVVVAEIGVGIGATAVEIIKALSEGDSYYFFDFCEVVDELLKDLKEINTNHVKLYSYGNTHKYCDSYYWNLAQIMLKQKEKQNTAELFDLVYLDGAHTFLYDGITMCLLKELMKPDGIIILDDMNWSIGLSPTVNPTVKPEIRKYYTDEMINSKQVALAASCFLDMDARFQRLDNYSRLAIYKKRA